MGNVFASSLAPASPLSPSPALSPPIPSSPLGGPPVEEIESKTLGNLLSSDPNPGTLEELHKRCKDVFPVNFEGAKLMVNKGLSNHFQISHTLNMSSFTPSGYRFGATYVGTKQISPTEAYPVLLGDIDPNGNLNANILHQHGNTRFKFASQIQSNKMVASQMTADYKGYDYTSSLTLGNIDIVNGSGVAVAHYLQNVAPCLALGGELAFQYGPQVPGGEIAVVSVAGRYTAPNYIVTGTLGSANAHICYYHKSNETTQVGVEVETNLRLGESVASFGYQLDIPKANIVFRGMVDSNWTVGATLEKKLLPLPFTFALSGMLNHAKDQYRFGCGFIIG